MKVWTNTDFMGHWPVGTSAAVIAETRDGAAAMLEAELTRIGLGQPVKPETMRELCTDMPGVLILQNGDY